MNGHVAERLSAFLDGELEERERAEVARHLEACAECARHLEELLAVDRMAAGVDVAAPEGYFDGFAARVRDRIRKGPRRVFAPVWALAAAAGLLLAVTVPTLMRQQRPVLAPAAAPAPPITAAAPASPSPEAQSSLEALGYVGDKRADARRGRAANEAPAKQAPMMKDEAVATRKPAPSLAAPPPAAPRAPAAAEPAPLASADRPEREVARLGETAPQQAERDAFVEERKQRQEGFASAPAEAAASGAEASRLTLQKTAPSAAFRALLERRAGTIAEARGLREAWRAFAQGAPAAEADEARVRAIEAGREAFGLSGESADLDQLRRDAAAYLKREDARQMERVRAILRGLSR